MSVRMILTLLFPSLVKTSDTHFGDLRGQSCKPNDTSGWFVAFRFYVITQDSMVMLRIYSISFSKHVLLFHSVIYSHDGSLKDP